MFVAPCKVQVCKDGRCCIAYGDVMKTYQAICQHPVPAKASATAAMAGGETGRVKSALI
jgi:hypothetical protein